MPAVLRDDGLAKRVNSMRIDVLTIFPDLFTGFLATSIPANAIESGALSCHVHDIRAHSASRHRKTDDRPFGGGPGMVMMCQPIFDAVKAAESQDPATAVRVLLSPQGERLAQPRVEWLAQQPRLLLLCGHYEGIDERVVEELKPPDRTLPLAHTSAVRRPRSRGFRCGGFVQRALRRWRPPSSRLSALHPSPRMERARSAGHPAVRRPPSGRTMAGCAADRAHARASPRPAAEHSIRTTATPAGGQQTQRRRASCSIQADPRVAQPRRGSARTSRA